MKSDFSANIKTLLSFIVNEEYYIADSRLFGYIDVFANHYTEDLSVSGLAKTFSLSPSYLSRSFTAYTGKSLYNYIQYRRIMLAKEMICANKPFMEVALECGFNDYSCFLRAFTKSTGKTPKEYRKYVSSLGLQI